jgi:hypothetical protein
VKLESHIGKSTASVTQHIGAESLVRPLPLQVPDDRLQGGL